MRPGPGLVVMALAFISGARRGSTSTSTSSKLSATSYSTSSTATIATPTLTQSTLVASIFPPTTLRSTYLHHLQVPQFVPNFVDQNLSKTVKRKDIAIVSKNRDIRGVGRGSGGGLSRKKNFKKRSKLKIDFDEIEFRRQHLSGNFKLSLFELPTRYQGFYDQTKTHRDRRSISPLNSYKSSKGNLADLSSDVIDKRTRSGIQNSGIYSASSLPSSSTLSSATISSSLNSAEEIDTNNSVEGLTVQYSQPLDPSDSFDEDDILGLVEDPNLISEEIYDRLPKLQKNKINHVKEEDYSESVNSYSSIHREISGSDTDNQLYSKLSGTNAKRFGDKTNSVGSLPILNDNKLLGHKKIKKQSSQNQKDREQLPLEKTVTEYTWNKQEIKNYYAANLVSDKPNVISSNRIATLSWSLVEENNLKNNSVNISDKSNLELPKKSIIESASPLTRLNPWISACDLAQPGTAPDLQGHCSASALPVAWVEEGPGPPVCPESCTRKKRRKTKRSVNVINLKIKNNDNKFYEDNLPYIKSKNYKNNNHVDHKNNNIINKMSLSYSYKKYNDKNNNRNHNKQNRKPIPKHMSNKVRRSAIIETDNNSDSVTQTQRTTTTMMESHIGTTTKTPVSSTTMTLTTVITTVTPTLGTEPETPTQETKNVRNITEARENITKLDRGKNTHRKQLLANKRNEKQPQNVANVTPILPINTNRNGYKMIDNNDNDVNKTNYNYQHQYSYLNKLSNNDSELKFSYLIRPDEHSLDEYDRNTNENDKFIFLQMKDQRQNEYQKQPDAKVKNSDDEEEPIDGVEMENTQCLDYLGDSLETSPLHLCSLRSPGQLVSRLRHLRLRHCCERNVFSALHTIALNATLSGGVECVRILMDIIDLDALATRITCEYAEILFRFDCRQIYSLIHQCHDCKEAYRRWVCSTLIPYFAEPNDVITPIFNYKNINRNTSHTNVKNITSNFAHMAITDNKFKSNMYESVSNQIANDHKGNFNMKRSKRDVLADNKKNCLNQTIKPAFEDALENFFVNKSTLSPKFNYKTTQQQEHSNYSISTANNVYPCFEPDSVITRVNKRTKRRIQFRRRKRIRPCLSVCQTVEQLCPYLLPADRAPAMPTQYAGEPTFLCLDLNIPEVTEQEENSINGPPDCCYTYCGNVENGICVQCDSFAWNVIHSYEALEGQDIIKRTHNVTLTPKNSTLNDSFKQLNTSTSLSARISIALRNDSETELLPRAIESLSYYAYYDGIYYYDDELQDMPYQAISGNCETVPSVTGRCTVPYYVSAASRHFVPSDKSRLLWVSLVVCCLYNVFFATCRRIKHERKLSNNTELISNNHQNWEIRGANTVKRERTRGNFAPMLEESKANGDARNTNKHEELNRSKITPHNLEKINRYSKCKIKIYCRHDISLFNKIERKNKITIEYFIQRNTVSYKSCKKINSYIKISNEPSERKRHKKLFYQFQLFHYINFNINDWWRRWCEFTSTNVAL